MSYELRYTPEARQGLTEVDHSGLKHLAERLLLKIASNPYNGKPLSGPLKGIFSGRITRRYRVLYQILTEEKVVLVLDVSHRKDVYR